MSIDPLIEHAHRMWKAEEVNAERYAARLRMLIALTTALFGVAAQV